MSIEPKPHSHLQKRTIDKAFSSPDKNLKSSRGTSSSPRYRSPIHTRLNPEHPEPTNCPTCEKRSSELPPVQYHESPPKIRPSHHNVVCEDCSEGSFSQVLKVVCLNQELPTGTQKIKIIESVPQPQTSSFPVVGSGKNMQVMYQEVYPPPKTELTSLIPESCRENGMLNYQLKEEDRKRVAIRRAEYANRIKGVSKTIVANVSPNGDRLARGQRTSLDLGSKDLVDKEMNLCRSEKKQLKDEGEENLCDFSFNKKNYSEDKEGAGAEVKVGKSKEKGGKGEKVAKVEKREKSGENSGVKRENSREKRENSREKREKGGEKRGKGEEGKKDREADIGKVSYFQKLHEHAKKDSLDGPTLSVKQKILAKLAGKDFAQFLNNDESNFCKNGEETGEKEQDFEESVESIDENAENLEEDLDENIEDIEENNEDIEENNEDIEENEVNPADNTRNLGNNAENLKDNIENLGKTAVKFTDPDESSPKATNTICPSQGSGKILSNKDIFKQIITRKNEVRELGDIEHSEPGLKQHFEEIPPSPEKSLSSLSKSSPMEDSKNAMDSPSSLRKTIKSGANTDRSQENPDQSPPNPLNDHIKTAKFLESFNTAPVNPEEHSHIDEVVLHKHKKSFDDLVKGESSDDYPVIERELTLELDPDSEISHTTEVFTLNTKLVHDMKKPAGQMEKIDSEGTEKFPNSDETRQMLLAGPQDCQETPPKDGKSHEPHEKVEEKVTPEQFNKLFLVLTDPKVIKGLRLLGGFADYLEKNGKDVLDWKF